MANVTFRLNKGKTVIDQSKPQKVYLRYRLGRKVDYNASIGVSVTIDDWDSEKQRVKNRSHLTNRFELNTLLSNLTNHFEMFELENRKNGVIPNYDMVKRHYDSYFTNPIEENQPLSFFKYVDQFIEECKVKPNHITKRLLSKNTIKDYELTRNVLQLFAKDIRPFDFDDIDMKWYEEFTLWCNEKNFKDNYKGKHIKTLKTFMNNALEQGITTNRNHQKRSFIVFKEDTDSIYLNRSELQTMWQLDLSEDPTQERARDLFLIGCYTGLRVSDYNNLKESSVKVINDVKMIVIKTQKTKRTVAIPMHPIVEAILNKYDGLPPRMFDQKINENIKKVARRMKLTEIIETVSTIAGMEVIKKIEKSEMVTTHTARRSFCTNAYLDDMDTLDIMAISGHTTEKNFLKYIKVTPEQRAVKMSKSKFFNDTNHLKVV